MANYTTANKVKAQIALNGAMANQDRRFRDPVIHKLFLSNSENFFPDYEALRVREDRVVEANFYNRTSRALGTSRSHNHTGTTGDSKVLIPTFNTRSDKFALTLKQQDISVLQDHLNNELLNSIANFMNGLDLLASTELFSNRSGVNPVTTDGAFDATNDVFEINETNNGTQAVFIAKMVLDLNKYQGMDYVFVCDSVAFRKFSFLANQGQANSTNTQFQFAGMTFIHDANLASQAIALDVTYTKGYWQVVPRNTIGALPWIPKQNRMGVSTTVAQYSTIQNPFDGLTYALHTYEERADGSLVNGYTQDIITQFETSIDIAYEVAPLSVSTETPIFAFALV